MASQESELDDSLSASGPVSSPVAFDPSASAELTDDIALSFLQRRDLPGETVELIGKNASVIQSRKVRMAVASHPQASRRISLRLIRELPTFDLMKFAMLPAVAADLKRAADELLVARLASITLGERISLARRGSALVAAALLLDKEVPVWQAAMENPRLTEAGAVKALLRANASPAFVDAVCHHAKWSVRPEIRMALLRNAHTPLARALEFARRLRPARLRDVLHNSRLPEKIKVLLRKSAEARSQR